MGGVPLLLMAIAMGITYGWQPDGRGGVDYIIQVPPDQVDAVLRSGEISSVIDPAIRGHVSRVIIKVGDGPLPRDTPAHLDGASPSGNEIVQASANDRTPMVAPAIVPSSAPNIVMKPQTEGQGVGGAGMGMPDSLMDAAAKASAAASRAGKGLGDGMTNLSADLANRERARLQQIANQNGAAAGGATSNLDDVMRNALGVNPRNAPNARTAAGQNTNSGAGTNASRLPPFAGGEPNNGMARVRTGGPTTEPANARDKKWFQVNAKSDARTPSTDPINAKAAWPAMVGPPDPRKTQAPAENRGNMQPLGSTPNFAHVPGGMSVPNSTSRTDPTAGMTAYQRAEYLRRLELQQAQNAGRIAQTPSAGSNLPGGFDPSRNPMGSAGQNSTNTFADGRGANIDAARRQQYDPRLTAAEIARLPIGAWSRDELGNAIDQVGRILDERGQLVSAQRAYELRNPRGNATASLERPFADSVSQMNRDFRNGQGYTGLDNRIARGDAFAVSGQVPATAPRGNGQPAQGSQAGALSPSDRPRLELQNTTGQHGDQGVTTKRRTTLAAQPLFNGLLLMSIVANVYLIVWLKNLRHQFSDMVASKRAAASDIVA